MGRTKKDFYLIGPPLIPSHLFLLGSGFLKDLLYDLLLLDQERTYNAVLDTVGAARTTVSTLNGLLGLGDLGVLAGAESRDSGKLDATVTTLRGSSPLLDVEVTKLSTRGLDDADLVGAGVVRIPPPVG